MRIDTFVSKNIKYLIEKHAVPINSEISYQLPFNYQKGSKELKPVIYFAFFKEEGVKQKTSDCCPYCKGKIEYIEFEDNNYQLRIMNERNFT